MPYDAVRKFEETIAEYTGAEYAVAVSSCTNALFLSLLYEKNHNANPDRVIELPHKTYIGVLCSVINAGFKVTYHTQKWKGFYWLSPFAIADAALSFRKDMFGVYNKRIGGKTVCMCLSFHVRKHIPIGRGGMILTNNKYTMEWLKKARFDGREEKPMLEQDSFDMLGYNMYMTPEQASRGLMLFDAIKDKELADIDDYNTYPDLNKIEVFK